MLLKSEFEVNDEIEKLKVFLEEVRSIRRFMYEASSTYPEEEWTPIVQVLGHMENHFLDTLVELDNLLIDE